MMFGIMDAGLCSRATGASGFLQEMTFSTQVHTRSLRIGPAAAPWVNLLDLRQHTNGQVLLNTFNPVYTERHVWWKHEH